MSCAEHADNPQPAWCLECMETTPPAPKLCAPDHWDKTTGTTVAVFTTTCIGCDEQVAEGDRIRLWSTATRQAWLHDRPSCTP